MTGADRNIGRNRHARARPHVGTVSVSIRSVRPVFMFIAARGHDGSAFLRDQGVSPMIFRDPEARLLHAVAVCLWEAACQLMNDSDLGLHVAEGILPGNFGALNYAVRTSETLGVGLQRLSRYHRFLHDVAEV